MEIPQIIAKLVIHKNLESLKSQQIVVSVKTNIMIMEFWNYANLAITHGFLYIKLLFFLSKTCVNEHNCLTCSKDKNRIFNSIENSCQCDIRFYDDGQNELC